LKRKKIVNTLIFLAPALIIYSLFQFYPIISGMYYGLTDWDGFNPNKNFVGLENFKELSNDPLLYKSAINSIKLTVLVVLIQNGIALLLAILLDRKLRGIAIFRTVYFIPVLMSTAVVGFIWSTIFNPIIGSWQVFFNFLGLETIAKMDLLGTSSTALYAIIFVVIWQYVGYSMIIYLAGLQTIPKDLYEAADIDGANRWMKFKHVTFALIAPALTINMILSTIGTLKMFDHVYVLTGGGPGNASQVIGTAIYTVAFSNYRFGYGVALSMLLFIVIAIISIIQMKVLKKREVEY
jgi:raffinose/stachyose/melibiose transport system permease protein